MEYRDDQLAVRSAVVELLIFMAKDECTDDRLTAIRAKIDEAVAIARAAEERKEEVEA